MRLTLQKRLAAELLKCSQKRVRIDNDRISDIKEAITKADIRGLINSGAISAIPKKGISRGKARKRQIQRSKGRQRGQGKRKGTANARLSRKEVWINLIRSQRKLLTELKKNKKISTKTFRSLYLKCKGGFFRSKRHIKLYLTEHKLVEKKDGKKKN